MARNQIMVKEHWIARFWGNTRPAEGGCIVWVGSKSASGYGNFYGKGKRKVYSAHRVSYEIRNGTIPDGLIVRHTCHNRLCVNPDHLIIGTKADNVSDMVRANRHRCPRGVNHPNSSLTEDDVRRIFALKASGLSLGKIAEEIKTTRTTVSRVYNRKVWRHIMGVDIPQARPVGWKSGALKGETNPYSKLTDSDIEKIRCLWKAGGKTQTEIGALFGIKQSTVSGILRGTSWRHVPLVKRDYLLDRKHVERDWLLGRSVY